MLDGVLIGLVAIGFALALWLAMSGPKRSVSLNPITRLSTPDDEPTEEAALKR